MHQLFHVSTKSLKTFQRLHRFPTFWQNIIAIIWLKECNVCIIANNFYSYYIKKFSLLHNSLLVDRPNPIPITHGTHILHWKSNVANVNIIYNQCTSGHRSFNKNHPIFPILYYNTTRSHIFSQWHNFNQNMHIVIFIQ